MQLDVKPQKEMLGQLILDFMVLKRKEKGVRDIEGRVPSYLS